jgi:HlyD family secretion protein
MDQPVEFRVDAYPDRRFPGKVAKIHMAPETLQNVVTYTVVVDAPNPDLLLLPGMTALVQISVATHREVLRVANAALRFSAPRDWEPATPVAQGRSRVWVLGDDGPRAVDLVLGPSDDRYTMVRQGPLEIGDQLAVGWVEP